MNTKMIRRGLAAAVATAAAAGVIAPTASASPATSNSWANNSLTGYCGDTSSGYVAGVQGILKVQGYYSGAIDAVFGSGTLAAVKSYQRAHGLTADGCVGKNTWNSLRAQLTAEGGGTWVTKGEQSTGWQATYSLKSGCYNPNNIWVVTTFYASRQSTTNGSAYVMTDSVQRAQFLGGDC